jgi:arabinogalactan oligomer/maltooligosaccharide transport system substrate-binding protein
MNFQRQESEIQVKLVYIPYDDLLEKYRAAVEIGEGPSLFLGAGEWGPGLFMSEEIENISKDVPLILRSEINPAALGAVSEEGTLFGLPVMISGVVMYRNTAIVSESPVDVGAMIQSAQNATEGEIIGAYLERGGLFAFPPFNSL